LEEEKWGSEDLEVMTGIVSESKKASRRRLSFDQKVLDLIQACF
jgi:hypothetical protein